VATRTERESSSEQRDDEVAPDVREADEEFPYDGGLVRLETPGSEPSED
jgi:hypothetical protein